MLRRKVMLIAFACVPIIIVAVILRGVSATVILVASKNISFHFPYVEADFSPQVPDSGIVGVLFAANSSFGCEHHLNHSALRSNFSAFLLVERGRCSFASKVRHGQDAGFSAVIVYDNEDGVEMVTMSGNESDIQIPAVFISKRAGEILLQYAGDTKARCHLIPAFDDSAWFVIAVCIISLLAVLAVLTVVLFALRHRLPNLSSHFLSPEAMGMSQAEVKSLSINIFQLDKSCSAESCAICLEKYYQGDKLRMLPCDHGFHSSCIDQWLMMQRPLCPICKLDARIEIPPSFTTPPPSEFTPLLNSTRIQLDYSSSSSPSSSSPSPAASLNSILSPHVLCFPMPPTSNKGHDNYSYRPLSSHNPSDLTLVSLVSRQLYRLPKFSIPPPVHTVQA